MKIVAFELNRKNPYDLTLYKALFGLYNLKIDILPKDKLYSGDFTADAIQFMFPQSSDIKHYTEALKRFNGRIICFVHNLKNHNNSKATEVTYKYTTDFIHFGNYSLDLLSKKFPNANHWKIPFHQYDMSYNISANTLKFPYKTLLFCGELRHKEEKDVLFSIKDWCLENNFRILVTDSKIRGPHIIECNSTYLSTQTIVDYYRNCDIIFCPRVKNLNSSIQCTLMFGKPIVGPAVGNLTEFLNDTGNFVYQSKTEIPGLLNKAYSNRYLVGQNNLLQSVNFSTEKVATQLKEIYDKIQSCID